MVRLVVVVTIPLEVKEGNTMNDSVDAKDINNNTVVRYEAMKHGFEIFIVPVSL